MNKYISQLNTLTVQQDCKMLNLTLFLNFLRGKELNAFIKLILHFYSCKAKVGFTTVCFDGTDVIS